MRLSLAITIICLAFLVVNQLSLNEFPNMGKSAAEINAEKIAEENRSRTTKEISAWENLAAPRPDFRDAYLKLAVLNFQVGNDTQASNYYGQAFRLDPNYMQVEKVGTILGGQY